MLFHITFLNFICIFNIGKFLLLIKPCCICNNDSLSPPHPCSLFLPVSANFIHFVAWQ